MRAWLFQAQRSSSPSTTSIFVHPPHLINLLKRCCESTALSPGKQVHQQIIQHGLDQAPFILTKLVQFYADCNHPWYAHKLFDELPHPNVFAWTAVLALRSRNGWFGDCLRGYCKMRFVGVSPDSYLFPVVLRVCAHSRSVDMGALVHKEVIVFGSESNLQVSNSLIGMYSKLGDVQSARRVFDGMNGWRDLLSWNSMISGYVSNGFYALAVSLVGAMEADKIKPDVVTWNSITDAYCRSGMVEEALEVFTRIEVPNIISWTTVISGFSRIGMHEASLGIFRDMMRSGNVVPDLDSLSTAMASSRFLQSPQCTLEIHAYGIKMHDTFPLYMSVGPALLTAYTKCGRIHNARSVFELMDKSDVVTWNAMILGFVDLGMQNEALEYFTKMQLGGVKSDRTTISVILPICDLKPGKQVHCFITRNNFDLEMLILNALICMYSRCGCVDSASLLFSKMPTRDLVSWNTMIGGLAMHGRGKQALNLVQEMKSSGHAPDSFTLTSALSACSHSGLVDEGLQLFSSMKGDPGFVPKPEHVACLVDMLSRAGRLSEAVELLRTMPVRPCKQVWGALLAASQAQSSVEGAKLAVEHLMLLEPENAGHYVTLANMYAGGGRWEDGVEVRKVMEERGVVKMMGRSRIEPGR